MRDQLKACHAESGLKEESSMRSGHSKSQIKNQKSTIPASPAGKSNPAGRLSAIQLTGKRGMSGSQFEYPFFMVVHFSNI